MTGLKPMKHTDNVDREKAMQSNNSRSLMLGFLGLYSWSTVSRTVDH